MKKSRKAGIAAVLASVLMISACQESNVVDNGGLETLGEETVTTTLPPETEETTEDTTTTTTTAATTTTTTTPEETTTPETEETPEETTAAPAPTIVTAATSAASVPTTTRAPSTTTAPRTASVTKVTTKAHVSGYQYGSTKYEIKHDLEYMRALNTDFIGWLTIKDTPIDIPVVQASDNKYYLEHNFYGEYDYTKVGTTFADCHVPVTATSRPDNLVIYGHNIRTGVGLAKITNYYPARYGSLNFYITHPTITYESIYGGQSTYVVFAGMFVNTETKHGDVFNYYKFRDFTSESLFYQYFEEVFDRSVFYNPDLDIKYGDTFITLSTCYYPMGANIDTRFVVFARQIRPGETKITSKNAYINKSPKYFDYYYKANGGSWAGRKWSESLMQGYSAWKKNNS